jgi:hypothetical protein
VDIDNLNEQEIIGDIIDDVDNVLVANIKGLLTFNKYFPSKAKITINGFYPSYESIADLAFREIDGTKFMINYGLSDNYIHKRVFAIDKIITSRANENKYYTYTSGGVDGLLYFKDIKSETLEIYQNKIPSTYSEKDKFYYEVRSNQSIDIDNINLIFLMLSTMTASKFFCISSHSPTGQLEYYAKWARACKLTIYGSGRLLYPIEFDELIEVKENINQDYFYVVLLLYTDFCTTKGPYEQLVKGCSLFDYIIENYIASNGKGSLGNNRTEQLFTFLHIISDSNTTLQTYISKLFKYYPSNIDELRNKKIEFLERRDEHIHRGMYLSNRGQLINIIQNIFVINELLRIIILQLHKIPFKNLLNDKFALIPVGDMENSIEFRRKTINPMW